MRERWKAIKGTEFLVSSFGRIYSHARKVPWARDGKSYWRKKRGRIIPGNISPSGYRRVNIHGEVTHVHKLVATAFLGDKGAHMTVNHKNLNKLDNSIENLEWVTSAENSAHAWASGACDAQYRPVVRLGTGVVYPSIHAAANSLGMAVGNLCSHLKGRQKTFAGDTWEYAKLQRKQAA